MSCDFFEMALPGLKTLSPYVPGKPLDEVAREFGLKEVIKLASNESPIGSSPKVTQVLQENIGEIFRYPDGDGGALKRAIASHVGMPVDRISLGNGSNEMLELMARLFAGPGTEIIFSQYGFAVYPLVTQAIGATAVEIPATQWGHDLTAMGEAITGKTRVVFVANPNNPTGTWINGDALSAFLSSVPDHVVVVLDEAYFEYAQDLPGYPDGSRLLERFPNVVVTRTFSKVYGLAGLRIGYALAHPDINDLLNRLRQPFNVNSLAQAAAVAALEDREHVKKAVAVNAAGMEQLVSAFTRMGLDYIPSAANFISVDVDEGKPVYDALLRQGVIVRPMDSYGMPAHLRVTVGTTEENQRFLSALESVLANQRV